jgi:hypothetical protein
VSCERCPNLAPPLLHLPSAEFQFKLLPTQAVVFDDGWSEDNRLTRALSQNFNLRLRRNNSDGGRSEIFAQDYQSKCSRHAEVYTIATLIYVIARGQGHCFVW